MCDCYMATCEKCDEKIPVHIGDFKYPRSLVTVYCQKHLPKVRATIFEVIEDKKPSPNVYFLKKAPEDAFFIAIGGKIEKKEEERLGLISEVEYYKKHPLPPYERKGWKCAIRLANGQIEPESEDVHPNISAEYKIKVLPNSYLELFFQKILKLFKRK